MLIYNNSENSKFLSIRFKGAIVTFALLFFLLQRQLSFVQRFAIFVSSLKNGTEITSIGQNIFAVEGVYSVCKKYLISGYDMRGDCSWGNVHQSLKPCLSRLHNKDVAIIGDSRMRHMFSYIKALLSGKQFTFRNPFNSTVHHDSRRNLTLRYYLQRLPDSSLRSLLAQWKTGMQAAPHYVILETGTWSLYLFGKNSLPAFSHNLTEVAADFVSLRNSTTAIWMQTLPLYRYAKAKDILKWVDERNVYGTIGAFGEVLKSIAVQHNIVTWTSAHDDAEQNLEKYRDHVHPGPDLIRKAVCQLLHAMDENNCKTVANVETISSAKLQK